MADSEDRCVLGEQELPGFIVGPAETGNDEVEVQLDDGREFIVPASSLTWHKKGLWFVDVRKGVREVRGETGANEIVVPVLAEDLKISTRKVPTGTVRVEKHTTEQQQTVSMPLTREHAHVERVQINRQVDGPMPVRREGDTIIMPVVEEVAVVEKRLMLTEEIRITRRRTTEQHTENVTLKQQHAEVERLDSAGQPVPVRQEELAREEQRPSQPVKETVERTGPTTRSILEPGKRIPSVLGDRPARERKNKILPDA